MNIFVPNRLESLIWFYGNFQAAALSRDKTKEFLMNICIQHATNEYHHQETQL